MMINRHDEQLDWVTGLLDDHGVEWWVESGTLLSLVRSGHLTEYDDDIDLGMWASDLDVLEGLLGEFEARGYGVQRRSYHGRVYKYQFLPEEGEDHTSESKRRLIDLMVFRRARNCAWTAQARPTQKSPAPGLSTGLNAAASLMVRYARTTPGDVEVAEFPKNLLLDVLTLSIPLEFVDHVEYDSDLGVYVPAALDEYLTYRYGDWRTPVAEWSLTDDGAVEERPPAALVL